MDTEHILLAAIVDEPHDTTAWAALADCLEEQGRTSQAELVRLRYSLQSPTLLVRQKKPLEARVRELLAQGVRPVVPEMCIELAEGVDLEMVYVSPGMFRMGCLGSEVDHDGETEAPCHYVTLTRGFWIGKYTVTQAQWQVFFPQKSIEAFAGPNLPVIEVNWHDCWKFCKKLSGHTGKRCRLPTEAEWEYACRAGTTTPFHTGTNLTTEQANFDGNFPYNTDIVGDYRAAPLPVGQFAPNLWGLYDMHGNVDEWCQDGMREYKKVKEVDPVGPDGGDRCIRGGSWFGFARSCRSGCRFANPDSTRDNTVGCRVVIEC